MERNLFTICSLLISRLNIAIVPAPCNAICSIRFSTKEVFPIAGRAAINIKSDFCSPAVLKSKSRNPVSIPVICPSCFDAFEISSKALKTTWLIGSNSLLERCCKTSKISFSAVSKISSSGWLSI